MRALALANIIHTLTCSYNHTQVYSYYTHMHTNIQLHQYLATLHEHIHTYMMCVALLISWHDYGILCNKSLNKLLLHFYGTQVAS